MPKPAYARTKPHLNIGVIGPQGHGKTTLTAALARTLGTTTPVPHGATARPTTGITRVAYETGTRHYAHADLPGDPRYTTNLLTGAAGLDGAVLVVSALDGVVPETAAHLLLARQAGVRHLVVALTKADAGGPELTDLAELDVRALLTAHGHDGRHAAVVRVSALRALAGDPRWTGALEALLDAVDTYVPTPVRRTDAPLLLPVERAFAPAARGTVVTGTIERGTVRPGARVRLLGPGGGPRDAVVTGLETFGRPMAAAEAGDCVALLLGGVRRADVRRGDAVTVPGGAIARRRFTARVRLPLAAHGGRRTPVASGYRAQFHFRTADVTGTVGLGPRARARPGETVVMTVVLDRALPLETGLPFVAREGGRTVGVGAVAAFPGGRRPAQ
ncbi:elongation factor Tu [Streptomyces eurocidicus]|uniref:Elongation factor Tu n=1 Tax=Streptomyces eurocidicus TaxID=66423 RepID=A0A2N8NQE3_STREU|nr:GTP-binding protein [Streptomyces eurocidicus]MBB5123101.1 elongation factor Tu [Streptomyces eurocidicus]MBF6056221.1 elongation factor Tu [Streptomyces eurocidicus]PNE30984.1 elongation factor Tu [Streptomyces eurocidicus]